MGLEKTTTEDIIRAICKSDPDLVNGLDDLIEEIGKLKTWGKGWEALSERMKEAVQSGNIGDYLTQNCQIKHVQE